MTYDVNCRRGSSRRKHAKKRICFPLKYSGFLMSPEPIWCLLVEWLFHNTLSEIQLTSSSPSCGNIYLRRGGEFLKFLLRFCRRALPWASIWVRRGVASKFLEIEAANKLSSEILRFSSFFKVPARHGDQGSWECTMEQDQVNSADSAIIFLINQWSVWIVRVPGGQGVGLHGPRGSRGRPTWSQGVEG